MLSNVPEEFAFRTSENEAIRDLYGLYESLKSKGENFYNFHVNDNKNDFANWVSDIVGENKDRETFSYIPSLCTYCGSVNMNSAIAGKASNPAERQELGFIKRHIFSCEACKSAWFALEK